MNTAWLRKSSEGSRDKFHFWAGMLCRPGVRLWKLSQRYSFRWLVVMTLKYWQSYCVQAWREELQEGSQSFVTGFRNTRLTLLWSGTFRIIS